MRIDETPFRERNLPDRVVSAYQWYAWPDDPLPAIAEGYRKAVANYSMFLACWKREATEEGKDLLLGDLHTAQIGVLHLSRGVVSAMEQFSIDFAPLIRMDTWVRLSPRRDEGLSDVVEMIDTAVLLLLVRLSATSDDGEFVPDVGEKAKPATVNERMASMVQTDPSLSSRTAENWALKLDVSAAAVKQTHTWKVVINGMRTMAEADRVSRAR